MNDREIGRRREISIKNYQEIKEDELVVKFYKENGPCCAGCDNWRYFNPVLGECVKSNMMGHEDRISLLGFKLYTGPRMEAGHMLTGREHHCENFNDSELPDSEI